MREGGEAQGNRGPDTQPSRSVIQAGIPLLVGVDRGKEKFYLGRGTMMLLTQLVQSGK